MPSPLALRFSRSSLASAVEWSRRGRKPPPRELRRRRKPRPLKGTLERVKVFGKSLEGNLMGESASPDVSIYLPPSYAKERSRRYPVVYLLHGYTGTDLGYFGNDRAGSSIASPSACSRPAPRAR